MGIVGEDIEAGADGDGGRCCTCHHIWKPFMRGLLSKLLLRWQLGQCCSDLGQHVSEWHDYFTHVFGWIKGLPLEKHSKGGEGGSKDTRKESHGRSSFVIVFRTSTRKNLVQPGQHSFVSLL